MEVEEITRGIINAIDHMISSSFEIAYHVLAVFGALCLVSTIIMIIVIVRDSKWKN